MCLACKVYLLLTKLELSGLNFYKVSVTKLADNLLKVNEVDTAKYIYN